MEQDYLPALTRQYRQLRMLYLAYLAAAAAALVLFFVDKRITLVILAASLLFHLLVVRRASRAYERAYIHACGQNTLARRLDGPVHTSQPVLEAGALAEVRLVAANTTRGSILCREGGAGTYAGRPVKVGDAIFTHSFPMDGKTHHEFVSGTWVTVELGRDTGLDWRLVHRQVMMEPSWEQMLREQGDLRRLVGFGPRWTERDWLMIRPVGTPDLPPEPVLKAIRTLSGATEKPVAVCLRGDKLHVFVTNRLLGQKVSCRVAPMAALVNADYLPELGAILALSDAVAA